MIFFFYLYYDLKIRFKKIYTQIAVVNITTKKILIESIVNVILIHPGQ